MTTPRSLIVIATGQCDPNVTIDGGSEHDAAVVVRVIPDHFDSSGSSGNELRLAGKRRAKFFNQLGFHTIGAKPYTWSLASTANRLQSLRQSLEGRRRP